MCTFVLSSFSYNRTKSIFTLWKIRLIKKSKYWFYFSGETFDWYLFQLIALLKQDFNWSGGFKLSSIDKVMTGT